MLTSKHHFQHYIGVGSKLEVCVCVWRGGYTNRQKSWQAKKKKPIKPLNSQSVEGGVLFMQFSIPLLIFPYFHFNSLHSTKMLRWGATASWHFNFLFVDLRKLCLLRKKVGGGGLRPLLDALYLLVRSNVAKKLCATHVAP